VAGTAALEQGREFYADRAWSDAYSALSGADRKAALAAEDLELLATAAYMIGREDEYFLALGRAHQAHLNAGQALPAARTALWIGMNLAQRGQMGRAGGWLGRARRLVEREGRECVEQGYLLIPLMFQHEASGDLDAAIATAAQAAAIAERFHDADLLALAVHSQGHLLVYAGRVKEGLPLLDESMVAVTTGELSPIVSGIVYCGVIIGCQAAFDLRRAQEWTAALAAWCREQPDMVAFTGRCLIHRTEILGLRGAWIEAMGEARRAVERCLEAQNRRAAGQAAYLEGDLYRLQGSFAAAEEAYRKASGHGREPQPGLALLRLAQGNTAAALVAIRRALAETRERPVRAALLPAVVEIALAADDVDAARSACLELEAIAGDYEAGMLDATVLYAKGALELAQGVPEAALVSLRHASRAWQELAVPYEAARARVLIAQACLALGDDEAVMMEREAARDAFAKLGAAPEIASMNAAAGHAGFREPHGLTPRELEVLRLIAAGQTNKSIAAQLVLSERTVERHVSNIFVKLNVSSRAAATAFAYEHEIV
jgi:DNA-binding CsgD family transcriptional regulator/tetratricopeptide (TPR) repeat protein